MYNYIKNNINNIIISAILTVLVIIGFYTLNMLIIGFKPKQDWKGIYPGMHYNDAYKLTTDDINVPEGKYAKIALKDYNICTSTRKMLSKDSLSSYSIQFGIYKRKITHLISTNVPLVDILDFKNVMKSNKMKILTTDENEITYYSLHYVANVEKNNNNTFRVLWYNKNLREKFNKLFNKLKEEHFFYDTKE